MTVHARLFGLAAAALLFATPVYAQTTPWAQMPAGVYQADDTHTSVTFKVSHMGLSQYTARFAKVAAELTLDPTNPLKSTLTAAIDPLSLRTDYPYPEKKDFDKKLSTDPEWLNGTQFKNIAFTTTQLEKTGTNTGRMTGDLTLLGVTKPVTLDVTFNGAYEKMPMREIPALGFSATGTLKRSDFGMTQYLPMIGDEVAFMIEIEFHKKDATQ